MSDERASPVCYGAEADDVYMGYASRDEILAALNELLEAERAGARVALASVSDATGPEHAAMMRVVRADEARWCAMLSRQIRRLGGTPSRRCGAFHGKAMAIADPVERLAFLNRGQAWVVRKLADLTRRVRDDALHADLRRMADSHVVNIDSAAAFLDRVRPPERGE
ncbi:DUF6306 domain-containing protein [Sphingopyxis granuli]|uniref:DUF6306 domain-containing protein n=1 Tax=Sphingopyxis granuli TaxID=267128 RepID=UPI001BAE71B6|nr:DUF6306 domain-containing protein [Sphingopyxis granuli]QUM70803.1 ferritin-like domain-containing protein [Sphingopyxis granuli]